MIAGILAGIGLAVGVLLVIAGLNRPAQATRKKAARRRSPAFTLTKRDRALAGIGLVCGILIATTMGWLIALVLGPVIAVGLPKLISKPPQTDTDRLQALEAWVRSLRGVLGANVPLSTAITLTLPSAPEPIRREVELLVARIHARRDLTRSLYAFGDDIGDRTGDYIATSLIGASSAVGAGLSETLTSIAEDVAREVHSRRDTATEVSKSTTEARYLAMMSVPAITLFILFTQLGSVYKATPVGELLLLVFGAMFAGCLVWMRKTATPAPAPRFLVTPKDH